MASSSKRKTTFAKLDRERRLVEKRVAKQAKKLARKEAAANEAAASAEDQPGAEDGAGADSDRVDS